MTHVIIVESPAKCKTIHKYLGKDYTVLASYGHIRDLPSKDGSVDPEQDFAMHYQISPDSSKQVKAIADAVKGADSLILATDPDREGEAISWHVLEALKEKKALGKNLPVQRVSFSSITKQAVQEAMDNPRELDMDLVNAQQARRALDYLVGFKLSPVLWRKLPGSRSAGRVQSVALRLICEREFEIERFEPREYWDIEGQFITGKKEKYTAWLTHVEGKKLEKFTLSSEKDAKSVEKKLQDKDYNIIEVSSKQVERRPHAPFTTSTLQQEAARKLGFSARRTMQTAQKLYEGIDIGGDTMGLITYMRTDGVEVAPEAIDAARKLIAGKYGKEYVPAKPKIYTSKAKNAQEAHEAIRPTDPARTPESLKSYLNDDQWKLYDLIWKRMITSQMENVKLNIVTADIESSDGYARFRATGSTVLFDGFYKVYHEGVDDDMVDNDGNKFLPPLEQGQAQTLETVEAAQHFTQPPPRFTEASLVKEMEKLGIGRPSTYATIISVLQDREYVRLDRKRFIPEMRGRLVTAFLSSFFPRYVEYDFTANLENELDDIATGKLDWKDALQAFWKDFSTNVEGAMNLEFNQVIEELNRQLDLLLFPGEGTTEERRTCPACKDGKLSLKTGKFGAFLGCSGYPECKHTVQLGGDAEEQEGGEGAPNANEPKMLGTDPETGLEVSVRKGPYGFYVQLGEQVEKEKPKRASIPKGTSPADVDLDKALKLLALPRTVGTHPETGKDIIANNGRYGPYIQHDGKFISLKEDDPLTIGINKAVTLIAEAPVKKGAEPLRTLGEHPDGGEIGVYEGRYGPYVKYKKINATIPKDQDKEKITLEEAIKLIEAQAAKKGKGKKATSRKKKTG